MTPEQFKAFYPAVWGWISNTLETSAPCARSAASFDFPRLPQFYSADLLRRAKVVLVDKCPVPPLSAYGLKQFAYLENMNPSGVTYLHTYFILRDEARQEALHFHELVHVVQWQILGPERFLAVCADGLAWCGYRNSPLEVMAYDHQARFDSSGEPYAVEAAVREQLQQYL